MSKSINLLLFWILLLTFKVCISQEKLLNFNIIDLKKNSSEIKDVIPIVNKENNNTAIFLADAKNVYGYLLDANFKVVTKLASEDKRRKYKVLLGYSITNSNDYNVILTDKKEEDFLFISFSFHNQITNTKEFKLHTKEEKLIQTVSVNNKFYLISINDKNEAFIYTFDKNGEQTKHNLNISNAYALNNLGKKIKKIDSDIPNSIELAAEKTKMYVIDNSIVFSFDRNNAITQVLTINLNDFTSFKKKFKKPLQKINQTRKKTNSFITNDKIFLFATTKEQLVLHILDLNTGEIIKEYKIVKDKPITIKNSPIIQEGGTYANYRELEKTKKFLRKIYGGEVGISAREIEDQNYHLTIGGYKEQAKGGPPMVMPGLGSIGAFGNVSFFFNPVMLAYNSSANTKSTRIESLFDRNFNHIKGEIKKNAFDKMQETSTENSSDSGQTVFKYHDYFIMGSYYPWKKEYVLQKFEN